MPEAIQYWVTAKLSIKSKKFISIDTRPILGNKGEVRKIPYDPLQDIGNFLDDIWISINRAGHTLPAYRYGEAWYLEDADTQQAFFNLGRDSNSNYGSKDEYKSIAEAVIQPGMNLIAVLHTRRK